MVEDVQSQRAAEYKELLESNQAFRQDDIIKEQFQLRLRPYFLVTGFLFACLLLEIFRWYTQAPPLPVVVFGLFLVSMVFAVFQLKEFGDHLKFIRLGKNGEPELRDVISNFSDQTGSTVYKDVVVGKEQIDYVLVNQTGIVLVNVCDWRTPRNSEATIIYSDEQILLNGYRPDTNPLEYMLTVRKWLENKLYVSLGKPIDVGCVIVFPEWFVRAPKEKTSVNIINPREMSAILESRSGALSDNDKTLLNYHIAKIIKLGAK